MNTSSLRGGRGGGFGGPRGGGCGSRAMTGPVITPENFASKLKQQMASEPESSTPTPAPTQTSVPTQTPTQTETTTQVPTPSSTIAPEPTQAPAPVPTQAPVPTPASTPMPTQTPSQAPTQAPQQTMTAAGDAKEEPVQPRFGQSTTPGFGASDSQGFGSAPTQDFGGSTAQGRPARGAASGGSFNTRGAMSGGGPGRGTGANSVNVGAEPSSFGSKPRENGQDGPTKEDRDRPPRRPRNEEGDEAPRPQRGNGYVPANRDVQDIFREDENAKTLYSTVFENDEDIIVKGSSGPIVCLETWRDVELHPQLLKNIDRAGYTRPRKIQSYTIPVILDGNDIRAQAETGSGKSAAFLVPIISKIARKREIADKSTLHNKPRCIVVEPTRELAVQLFEQGRKLASMTGVQVVKCYGEYDYKANVAEVLQGCDIIVGTPGRLLAFIMEGIIAVSEIEYFVLDEADRLLDNNFQHDVAKMTGFKLFPPKEKRQTLMFSATFPPEVTKLVNDLLRQKHASITNKNESAPNAKVLQVFHNVEHCMKKDKAVAVLAEEFESLKATDPQAKRPRTLVFVETKRDADVTALYLCQSGLPATTINGDRTQELREQALAEFRKGEKPILVATDVCARGIDVKDLDIVINLDMPRDKETYVHRIGRTGRLQKGRAISFFYPEGDQDQRLAPALVKMLKEQGTVEIPEYILEAEKKAQAAGGVGGGFGGGFKATGANQAPIGGGFGSGGGFAKPAATAGGGFGTGGGFAKPAAPAASGGGGGFGTFGGK